MLVIPVLGSGGSGSLNSQPSQASELQVREEPGLRTMPEKQQPRLPSGDVECPSVYVLFLLVDE